MTDSNEDKEKVAYRSTGWLPKGIAYVFKVKSAKLTRSTSPAAAEGGPK